MHMELKSAPKSAILTTSVTVAQRDWIDAHAKAERRTRAEIVRFAVEEYIERHEAEEASAA